MAAAIEAARCGLPSALLDEGAMQAGPTDAHERLRRELREVNDRVRVLSGTAALGIFGDREVLWARGDASGAFRAERIILATGGHPRPVPFPGWTLPGVIAIGEARALDEARNAHSARRALVAGTGPALLDAARRLLEAGVEVVSVLEAGMPPWADGTFPRVAGEPGLLEDASDSWRRLARAGVPVLFRHTIFAVHGRDAVAAATFGPVDPDDWRPLKDRARDVDVDLVVVGFGDVGNHELAVLAGCRQRFDPTLSDWATIRDPLMRTTAPGIFAVGDGSGVAGGLVAEEEGRIAGITAAEDAGAIDPGIADARRAGPLERLRALAAARATLDDASRLRPGLLDLVEPDTVLCPCEGVTLAAFRSALDEGARDLSSVKLLTRLGMGMCQGRRCGPPASSQLCRASRRTPEQVGRINPRPPVRPVTLGTLARMAGVAPSHVSDPGDAIVGGAS
jgi:NADPH-dependent 2,4-dienoyl-CoA reductase/sulfur reductase-like enzyme